MMMAILVVVGVGATAQAETPQAERTIVLQAHVGQHPPISNEHLAPLLDELETLGFAARPATIARALGDRAPRPGLLDEGVTVQELRHAVDIGFHAFTQGKFDDAVTRLEAVIERMRRNPATLVHDSSNVDTMHKALVVLAICQARRRNLASSVDTMSELIRAFPTQPLSRANYGPEAFELYRSVAKQVQAMGRGTLAISVDDAKAVIFVDGQIRGMQTVTLGDLVPGTYRILIQVPGSNGRQYAIEVRPNEDHELSIAWAVDSALWVTDRWVGLLFEEEAARAREARYAASLARRAGPEAVVAVIAQTSVQGGAGVIGTIYRGDGKIVRSAVVTDPEDATRLRSLARFLADGTAAAGLSVVEPARGDERPRDVPSSAPARSASVATLLVLAAGVGAVATGGVLYAIDEDDTGEKFTYRDTATAGVAVGAVGLAAIAVGLWRWTRRGDSPSTPTVSALPGGGVVGWAGQF